MAFSNEPSSDVDSLHSFYDQLLRDNWKEALGILRSISETFWVNILSQQFELYHPCQPESPVFYQPALHYIVAKRYNSFLSSILETLNMRLPAQVPLLIETRDDLGNTPLMIAVREGTSTMAKILLKYKADIKTRNNNNEMPLFLAIALGESKIVEEMTREEYNEIWFEKDSNARTPLHHALVSAIQGPKNYLQQEYEKHKRAYGHQKHSSVCIIHEMEQVLSSAKVRRTKAMEVLYPVFSHCINLYCRQPNYPDDFMDNIWVNFIEIAVENSDIQILNFLLEMSNNDTDSSSE